MFGSGPGALKTEPSAQPPQELAIAHLVGDTFEPGIPGQEDFLATHPSDMIGDMPSNDCWPGTGHFSDAFDYFPMQGPGLPFQTAPGPASNAGTQHDEQQQQQQHLQREAEAQLEDDDFNSYAAGPSSKREKVDISPFSKDAEKTGLDEAGGMSGQEDILAAHPSDMIGDMPSNGYWPGTGGYDPFDFNY